MNFLINTKENIYMGTHGGYRLEAGRKKGSVLDINHRSSRIVLSCTESNASQIKELNKQSNKSVTKYIIDIILHKS